jgi:hypothetical protein
VKQPWAALLVHGVKTVEVRRWSTSRRGRVLIHAARVPDERPQAWQHVPPELKAAAQQRGGVIGAARLIGCTAYRDRERFGADQALHLNDPAWFEAPVLFGFTFTEPEELPFQRCPGWLRFFAVTLPEAPRQT